VTPLLGEVRRGARRVEVRLAAEELRRFAPVPFFAEYDELVDLEALPDEIVLVPLILNLAPVVWATGGTYEIQRMDARLAASLDALREALQSLYPDLPWSGEIVARERVPARGRAGGGTAALFSGGVDSIYTALADPAPGKLLITVCGSDIAVDNEAGWANVRAQGESFATERSHRAAAVRSNFFTFLNKPQLNHLAPSIPDWWAYVQHGMGLSGLTAPILASAGASRLLVAATHTEAYETPWGSSPRIDDLIAWADVRVLHHGFDVSRQAKIRELVEIARAGGEPPSLRVCYVRPDGAGGNCGECEKCLRTATGLIVEGEDPRRWGFPFAPAGVGERAESGFRASRVATGEDEGFMWRDIQERARERPAGASVPGDAEAYLRWLDGFDFDSYLERYARKGRARRRVGRALARYPRLQSAVRRGAGRGG